MTKCPTKEQLLQDILSDLSWFEIAEKYGYTDARFLRKKAALWDLPPRRKILKPTKSELSTMIYDQHLTPYQIAKALGYGEGGWSNIYAYCREYGLEFDYSINHELRKKDFTQRQKEIVFGTLLGDGYLRPTNGNSQNCSYALSCCHGEKQLEYLKWKFSEFADFVTTKDFRSDNREFHGNAPTYQFSTVSHPFLKEAHDICYWNNGKKDISLQWLEQLTPLSIAVWYMDDGSLNKRYHTIVLCTNSFSLAGQQLAIDYLKDRFDISAVLEPRRNQQTVIRINASQSRKFMDLVGPHIPSCMSYKLW
jgi:hypothetical protein